MGSGAAAVSGGASRFEFLRSEQGRALLERAQALRGEPPHRRVDALRQVASSEAVAWVLEQVDLASRATKKLPSADGMLFERTALEQATAWEVATHRASQWPESPDPIHDLCAGLGVDAWAAAVHGHAVVVYEVDPDLAMLLGHNVHTWGLSKFISIRPTDCTVDAPFAGRVFLDPDRRAEGQQNRRQADYAPAPATWDSLLTGADRAMLKLAVIEQSQEAACESLRTAAQFEWISLRGRARERRVYVGTWDRVAPRRATSLPSGRFVEGAPASTPPPVSIDVGAYLLDPDVSIVRADLVGHVAKTHGLHSLHRETTYLSADQPIPEVPGHWLRVEAVLPHQPKAVRKWLRANDIGTLIIRKQGIRERADDLRKRYAPRGPNTATLLFTRAPNGRQIVVAGSPAASDEERNHGP